MTAVSASSTLHAAFEAATVAALETLTHITRQRDNLREARMAATEILRMARGMFAPKAQPAPEPEHPAPAPRSGRGESASSRRTNPARTNAIDAVTQSAVPSLVAATTAPASRNNASAATTPPPPSRKNPRNFMAAAGALPVF